MNAQNKQEGEDFVRSFITFNKGGKWSKITAPTKDSLGKDIRCYIEDNCSLHLNLYSSKVFLP